MRTPTVTQIDSVTKIMVNRRYLPSNGTARDVGGIISASSKKNTVRDRRMDMQRVTCKNKMVDAYPMDLHNNRLSIIFTIKIKHY